MNMDLIDFFLENRGDRKPSGLEKLTLFCSFLKQLNREIDPNYQSRFSEPYCPEDKILSWLDLVSQTSFYQFFKVYYRPELQGIEKIPDKGGAMLVSNHTTPFFADVTPIYFGIYEKKRRVVYGLGEKILKNSDILKMIGGTKGSREMGMKLLKDDKLTLVCPEGIDGACRPWYLRNQIIPVKGFDPSNLGYLKLAYAADKPLIPIANVGAEKTIFILGNVRPEVGRIAEYIDSHFGSKLCDLEEGALRDILKLKIVPLPLNLFPLPSKVDAYVGDPIDVREMLGSRPEQQDFAQVNRLVMGSLQELMYNRIK